MNLKLNFLFALVLCLSIPSPAYSQALNPLSDRLSHEMNELSAGSGTPPPGPTEAGIFEQRLNRDSVADLRTFAQRYWINSSYVTSDPAHAPVLLIICGESSCGPGRFNDSMGAHAKALGAHLVAVEHRFFGKSIPFEHLSTANLQFLTTHQVMLDLAALQTSLMNVRQLQGKWIAVGASYGGDLAAFYRSQYPELVAGAYAVSAPVKVLANFEQYDHHFFPAVGEKCAAKIQAITSRLEQTLDNPITAAATKALFGAEDIQDNRDFLYVLGDINAVVFYSQPAMLCDPIQTEADSIAAYARVIKEVLGLLQLKPIDDTVQALMSDLSSSYARGFGARQWFYMTCNEYGFFQTAYHKRSERLRSAQVNLDYYQETCRRVFGKVNAFGPETTYLHYFLPLLLPQTRQIYFTNGSRDPWSEVSITPKTIADLNLKTVSVLIEGEGHSKDLYPATDSDSSQLIHARLKFQELARVWIK